MGPVVRILRAGRLAYRKAVSLQQKIRDDVINGISPDILVTVEHTPVYTIGIRDKSYTPEEEARLRLLGADFCRTNRGGLITFHGPGQLVVYPILNLKNYQPSVRWYVCHLEKTIIEVCGQFDLQAGTTAHTGVWVNDSKICAMGVHVSRYTTTHGLALNCNIDLAWFSHIIPCGIPNKTVTSLSQQLNRNITTDHALPGFLDAFENQFKVQCVDLDVETVKRLLIPDVSKESDAR